VLDLKSSQCCLWRILSSGMWWYAVWYKFNDIWRIILHPSCSKQPLCLLLSHCLLDFLSDHEDGDKTFQNVGKFLLNYTALHPRGQSTLHLLETEVSFWVLWFELITSILLINQTEWEINLNQNIKILTIYNPYCVQSFNLVWLLHTSNPGPDLILRVMLKKVSVVLQPTTCIFIEIFTWICRVVHQTQHSTSQNLACTWCAMWDSFCKRI
jgi:hypothetical protein